MESKTVERTTDFHVFHINGDTVLALPSGAVFMLNPLAADIINVNPSTKEEAVKRLREKYPENQVEEAFFEFKKILSTPIKDHEKDSPPRYLRALCLNITHRCNFACTYCFAERLTDDKAKDMPEDVIKNAFDLLVKESKGVNKLQVDFFGGEPLLVFDKVKKGIEYARSLEKKTGKQFIFTLTTNASLLTEEKIDFFKKQNVSLILSLDGNSKVNDMYRKYKNSSQGTYKDIIKNIKMVQKKMDPKDYYIRGTFTSKTMDILTTLRYFHKEGFYNVSLEPVSSPSHLPYSLNPSHLSTLLEKYRQLAIWLLDRPMLFYHFNLEMDNPLCLTRRITSCGAGVEYMAVDPEGNLYPCHQFIEFEDFLIGNVWEGIKNYDIVEKFKSTTIYTKKECKTCWARFYCGGGCHFQHFVRNGDIRKPSKFYCDLFKGRLESALWHNIKKRLPVS